MRTPQNHLPILPPEIWMTVFGYLDVYSLLAVQAVNRQFRDLSSRLDLQRLKDEHRQYWQYYWGFFCKNFYDPWAPAYFLPLADKPQQNWKQHVTESEKRCHAIYGENKAPPCYKIYDTLWKHDDYSQKNFWRLNSDNLLLQTTQPPGRMLTVASSEHMAKHDLIIANTYALWRIALLHYAQPESIKKQYHEAFMQHAEEIRACCSAINCSTPRDILEEMASSLVKQGNLTMLRCLDTQHMLFCSSKSQEDAARFGQLEVLKWLRNKQSATPAPAPTTLNMNLLILALHYEHANIVYYLLGMENEYGTTSNDPKMLAKISFLNYLQHLRNPEYTLSKRHTGLPQLINTVYFDIPLDLASYYNVNVRSESKILSWKSWTVERKFETVYATLQPHFTLPALTRTACWYDSAQCFFNASLPQVTHPIIQISILLCTGLLILVLSPLIVIGGLLYLISHPCDSLNKLLIETCIQFDLDDEYPGDDPCAPAPGPI